MSVSEIMYRSDGKSRIAALTIDGKSLVTPTYFPAISSFGIKHRVDTLIDLLIDYSYPRLLISAYDIYRMDTSKKHIYSKLRDYMNQSFVFVDSGRFESWWYKDTEWDFKKYSSILKEIEYDFYSSLDVFPSFESRSNGYVEAVLNSITTSRSISESPGFIAVYHGSTPVELLSTIKKTIEKVKDHSSIIAIPERDCGVNIIDKAVTIAKTRQLLDKFDPSIVLHILGCGHPKSLALFSYCGADSYDSLDWITSVANEERFDLSDISYLDYVNCECKFCTDEKRTYIEKVLLHNLRFYQNYMKSLRQAISDGNFLSRLKEVLGSTISRDAIRELRLE